MRILYWLQLLVALLFSGSFLIVPQAPVTDRELPPATARLLAEVPGVGVIQNGARIHALYGVPMTVGRTPDDAVAAFWREYRGALGVERLELELDRAHAVGVAGTFTIYAYDQRMNGLSVENGLVRVLVRHDGLPAVVYVGAKLASRPRGGFAPIVVDGAQAIASQLATESFGALEALGDAELVVFYREDEVDLEEPVRAWKIRTESAAGASEYEAYTLFVDAATGDLVHVRDDVHHTDVDGTTSGLATPGTFPDTGSNPPVSFPLSTQDVGIAGGNSTTGDRMGNFTIPNPGTGPVTVEALLEGPWVRVFTDQGSRLFESTTVTPPGPANLAFNGTPSQFETAQVNAYIHTVGTHDFFKDRQPAFTPIDLSIECNTNLTSSCNAFYSSANQSINFYNAGGGCVNTAYSSVVAHEYGHFVVNRLGLSQGSFGEGFGDCMSLLQYDDPILGRDFSGPGTNVRDPLTSNIQYPCGFAIHTCGMVLGGSWFRIRQNFGSTYGSAAGLDMVQQLFTDWAVVTVGGIGNDAAHPTTAIEVLTLDDDDGNLNNGTPNYQEICDAYAVHNIDCPALPPVLFSYPDGLPNQVAPNVATTIRVHVASGTEDPISGTGTVSYAFNGGGFSTVAMTETAMNEYEATIPAAACFDYVEFYFSVDSTGGVVSDPPGAPGSTYAYDVVTGAVSVFSDDFQSDQGWTVSNENLSDGQFERGAPAGDGNRGDPLNDADGSGQCYLTDNVAGNSDVDGGPTRITSPAIDFSSGDGHVAYSYWMYNSTGDDSLVVEVSDDNGASWVTTAVYTGGLGGWQNASFIVGDFVTPSNQVRVRFSVADNPNDSVTEAAIDAVSAVVFICDEIADCNNNGIDDAIDIADGTSEDCNSNGIPDECDISSEFSNDCNTNGIPDECDIASGFSNDCNGNTIPDECDLASGTSLDCNTNGIPDECDIASGFSNDCNGNGVPDECDLSGGTSLDCNSNGIPDECDIASGFSNDCNSNGIPDECDIASGFSDDCNNNGVPDDCDLVAGTSLDCNSNGIPDECDIASGFSTDCNGNGVPDDCDIASGFSNDCNTNGVPDECDISGGASDDCNTNGIPDECELADGSEFDCNSNGVLDSCDIASGTSLDCNTNGIPDECDIASGFSNDCNANGIPDECDIASGFSNDCNTNGIPDECDISAGTSGDCNTNGIPDECEIADGSELDCNGNGVPDSCDIAAGTSLDCNGNNVPDECDLMSGTSLDCNGNGIPDECDLASGFSQDCNGNGIPDECDIASGFSNDCNTNGIPDECDISGGASDDCNTNGIPDECELADGSAFDCNNNGVLDSCDLANGTSLDCNSNGIPDECDIASGFSEDCNTNGIPDECDLLSGASDDCNSNGIPDECDLASGFSEDCNTNGIPDECDIASGAEEDCNSNGVPDVCDIAAGTSLDANGNGIPDECDDTISFCGVGATNLGCGPKQDNLTVNGSTGGATRTITVSTATPISVTVAEPVGETGDGQNERLCIYAWFDAPGPTDDITLPKNLGNMCFGPFQLATRPADITYNSVGAPNKLGIHDAPLGPARIPEGGSLLVFDFPGGFGVTGQITFQGVVQDVCTQGDKAFSVTNGVVVDVQ